MILLDLAPGIVGILPARIQDTPLSSTIASIAVTPTAVHGTEMCSSAMSNRGRRGACFISHMNQHGCI